MNRPDDPPSSPDGVSLSFPQSEGDFSAAVDAQSARWPARILYSVFAVCATYAIVVFVWYFVVGPIPSLVPVVVVSVILCVVLYFGIRQFNRWVVIRRLLRSKQGDIIGSTCTITIQRRNVDPIGRPGRHLDDDARSRALERVDQTMSPVFPWTTRVNVIPIPSPVGPTDRSRRFSLGSRLHGRPKAYPTGL